MRAHRQRLSIGCLLGLLLLAGSLPLPAETIRVATFNVHNYLTMDRWANQRWREDYPKPAEETEALREIIRRIQPDVLALQEMGGPEYLQELQEDLAAEGLRYDYAELMIGPDDERHLALLSRVPPRQVISHGDIRFRYFGEHIPVVRGLQEIVFESGGLTWSLYNVHLKSRYTSNSRDPQSQKRRLGEAQALRDLIREKYPPGEPASRYLVVGDFNAAKDSPTLRRFLTVNGEALTVMLPCYDSRGEAWTFHYRKRDLYERVDFILASPPLLPFVRGGKGTVVDLFPESTIASDHRMLYLDLDFPQDTRALNAR